MNTRAGRCCRSLFSRTVGPQNAEERACRELGVPVRVQPTMRLEAVLGTLSLCPMGCGGGCLCPSMCPWDAEVELGRGC